MSDSFEKRIEQHKHYVRGQQRLIAQAVFMMGYRPESWAEAEALAIELVASHQAGTPATDLINSNEQGE